MCVEGGVKGRSEQSDLPSDRLHGVVLMDEYRPESLRRGEIPGGVWAAPAFLVGALLFALVVQQVAVSGRRPRELGAAVRAARLGGLPRLFPLVPEEVAECRELPAVAPMLPALRLRPAVYHPDLPVRIRRSWGHESGNRVHAEVWVLDEWPAARSGISFQVSGSRFLWPAEACLPVMWRHARCRCWRVAVVWHVGLRRVRARKHVRLVLVLVVVR